ncbi:MAG: hypothetical protein DYG84_00970 [Candidatus Brocadia sp. AMX3]|uniref:Hydroxylamine oxidoreductase-like protein n=1 Tax=Candidatus Brocadia fulgida TaxID=380242 RepID=A0A0M2UQE5_9BACT|nr:MAG: hydroxylamine oxidoreductase-like protein [Candidatus Brocadia fulgida]MBV6519591.1 hypothetical protein [Candidatus Brocadia fulgida]MCC6324616.1 hypothetical protein [Candidatus Brocadia sp.]MCE7910305.1 hypothetical protein [Candidatus Brocadia sp. AMX3]MDG5995573.1 hypothetical protein [Candidatus Brocadia sp.]
MERYWVPVPDIYMPVSAKGDTMPLKYVTIVVILTGLALLAGCATQKETTNIPQKTIIPPPEEAATPIPGKTEAVVSITKKERGITEESLKCITCHEERRVTHGWVADWEGSKHARKGVGCEVCHVGSVTELATTETAELEYLGTQGSTCEDKKVRRHVTASMCGKCHKKEHQEFMRSRHSISWDRMLECGNLLSIPKDLRSEKCAQCHNIQFKCDSCHTRHTFNTLEAKTPEACRTCHMGPDNPHYEMYISSKHGSVYTASQAGILKESRTIASLRSPVCVTCHMPQGTHDLSFGLTYGPVAGSGLPYIDRNGAAIDEVEFAKKRTDMLSVCTICHSLSFAKKTLLDADDTYKNIETVIKDARDIVTGLERENLLSPPIGKTMNTLLPGHAFVQEALPSYTNKPRIERLFIQLTQGAAVAWKGAYHGNPGHTHLCGWAKLQEDLSGMKEEVTKIREEAEFQRKMKIKLR